MKMYFRYIPCTFTDYEDVSWERIAAGSLEEVHEHLGQVAPVNETTHYAVWEERAEVLHHLSVEVTIEHVRHVKKKVLE